MRALALLFVASAALADPATQAQTALDTCLSCHLQPDGQIDLVGLAAIEALPAEWPFLFEDSFDMDGDGIAGRMKLVSGGGTPIVAKYGSTLSAGRFQDFALIAGAAHGISDLDPETLALIEARFTALSPAPVSPFLNEAEQNAFEQTGCAACHVTRRYTLGSDSVMPLSDFLLHDLGAGPKRTKPLWACRACVRPGTDPHGKAD